MTGDMHRGVLICRHEPGMGITKLGFIRRAPNHSTTELLLLIVSMSSPTIGNTNVVGWASSFKSVVHYRNE